MCTCVLCVCVRLHDTTTKFTQFVLILPHATQGASSLWMDGWCMCMCMYMHTCIHAGYMYNVHCTITFYNTVVTWNIYRTWSDGTLA